MVRMKGPQPLEWSPATALAEDERTLALAPTAPAKGTHRRLVPLIMALTLAWALAHWLSHPHLDAYHDMLENHAWSQQWAWGTFKHPPLFSWVVAAWFSVVPRGDLTYKLLSYANVAVALLGVVALGRRLGLRQHAPSAALVLMWCLPYTTLAAKFNANTQLLSLWPWTAVAMLASVQALTTGSGQPWRRWAWMGVLGLLGAACMLAKYFSGVFLVSLLAAAATSPAGRAWLRSPWPWGALLVGVAALAPHVAWMASHDFATFQYALDQGDGQVDVRQAVKFALLPLGYWAPGWLACAAVFAWHTPAQGFGGRWRLWLQALTRCWRPRGWNDPLFWLAFTPWALSLVFGLSGAVQLSMPWAIPIGYAYSLLWLRNLAQPAGDASARAALRSLDRPGPSLAVAAVVVAASVALAAARARHGDGDYNRPTAEAARAVLADWRQRHPELKLGWSAGAWAENALMGFYADPTIRALPGLPDQGPARLSQHAAWEREGGVIVCGWQGLEATSTCVRQAQGWLADRGQPAQPLHIAARREGWRFPGAREQRLTVLHVSPLTWSAQGTR